MTSYVLSKSSTHEAVQHIVCKGDLFFSACLYGPVSIRLSVEVIRMNAAN